MTAEPASRIVLVGDVEEPWPDVKAPGTADRVYLDALDKPGHCPCPRTSDGGHVSPPSDCPDHWFLEPEHVCPAGVYGTDEWKRTRELTRTKLAARG